MDKNERPPTSRAKPSPPLKRRCHRCQGSGLAPCTICNGSGQVMTTRDVNGHPVFGRCTGCLGTKKTRCPTCAGQRFI